LPFEAESMAGLCVAIANAHPRKLLGDVPDLPPELEAVIEKCLEKNPDHRYQNVSELATDLSLFAPMHARSHVERIQRLVGGGVPPSQPSFSSLSRITADRKSGPRAGRPDAETLGPITGSDLMARVRRKPKQKWIPWAAAGGGVALLAMAVALGVAVSSSGRTESTSPPAAATSVALPTTSVAPPASTAPIAAPPSASVAALPAPTVKRPTNVGRPTGTSTAAPSASIIMGISHDRK
jgi:serine/threonine-protein kinase